MVKDREECEIFILLLSTPFVIFFLAFIVIY